MADLTIKYTDSDGIEYTDTQYQCEHPSIVYLNNFDNECVYVTEKNPFTRNESVYTITSDGYTFREGCIYFIRIEDLEGNTLVYNTRIYNIGDGYHEKIYGVCKDGKCRQQVLSVKEFKNGVVQVQEFSGSSSSLIFYSTSWSAYCSYPNGLNKNNCAIISADYSTDSGSSWSSVFAKVATEGVNLIYRDSCIFISVDPQSLKDVKDKFILRLVYLRYA